jgi:hypothetical protein
MPILPVKLHHATVTASEKAKTSTVSSWTEKRGVPNHLRTHLDATSRRRLL